MGLSVESQIGDALPPPPSGLCTRDKETVRLRFKLLRKLGLAGGLIRGDRGEFTRGLCVLLLSLLQPRSLFCALVCRINSAAVLVLGGGGTTATASLAAGAALVSAESVSLLSMVSRLALEPSHGEPSPLVPLLLLLLLRCWRGSTAALSFSLSLSLSLSELSWLLWLLRVLVLCSL
jgi:hypothetical protein